MTGASLKRRARTTGRGAVSVIRSRRVSPLARRLVEQRLTYLSWVKLRSLERCLRDVRQRGVPGGFVALGGSAILMASRAEGRRFDGYDVFATIPPPSEADGADSHERYAEIVTGRSRGIGGDPYYGYLDDLYGRVVASFAEFGLTVDGERVALHRGLFEETLYPEGPIALAHIDSDWYEPVRLCLERIVPLLSPGGQVVVDDYFDYGGCKRAVDELLADRPELGVGRDAGHRVLMRAA